MARNAENYRLYCRQWRREHPDQVLAIRLRAAAKLLARYGWRVEPPAAAANE